jgi:hypothetical protein
MQRANYNFEFKVDFENQRVQAIYSCGDYSVEFKDCPWSYFKRVTKKEWKEVSINDLELLKKKLKYVEVMKINDTRKYWISNDGYLNYEQDPSGLILFNLISEPDNKYTIPSTQYVKVKSLPQYLKWISENEDRGRVVLMQSRKPETI